MSWLTTYTPDIASLAAIAGVVATWFKNRGENKRLMQLHEEEIEKSRKERRILIKNMLIVMRAMKDGEMDGEIDQAIKDTESFLLDAAHRHPKFNQV